MKTYGQEEQIEDFSVDSPLEEQALLPEVSPSLPQYEKQYTQLVSDLTERISGFAPNLRSMFYVGMLAVALSLPYAPVYAEDSASIEAPTTEVEPAAPAIAPEYLELPEIENYFVPVSPDGTFVAGQPHEFSSLTPEDELAFDNAESVLPAIFRKYNGEKNPSIVGTMYLVDSEQVAENMYLHRAVGPAHGFNEVYDVQKNNVSRYLYGIKIGIQGVENFYPMDVAFSPGYEDRELNTGELDSDRFDEAEISFITDRQISVTPVDKYLSTRGELSVDPSKLQDQTVYITGYPQAGYELSDKEDGIVRLIVKTTINEVNISADGQINFIKFLYPEKYSEGMSGGDITIVIDGRLYSIATFRGINPGKGLGIGVPHEDNYENSKLQNPAVPGQDLSGFLESEGSITFEDMKIHIWNAVDIGEFDKASNLIGLVYELNPDEISISEGRILFFKHVNGEDRTYEIDLETLECERLK